MATSPRNKAETRAAVQAATTLTPADTLGSNIGDDTPVPAEFRMPSAHIDPEVITEVPAGTVSEGDVAAFREWQAQQVDKPDLVRASEPPRTVAMPRSEAKTQISDSGRAPSVSNKDRVWIILDDNDEIPPGGQFVGVNGVGYMLLPGVEAFVPRAICDVLDHAIKSVPVQDPVTTQITGWKNRKRFPYSIVSAPARAEA